MGAAADEYKVVLNDTLGWDLGWKKKVKLIPIDDTHVMSGLPDTVSDGGMRYNAYTGYDVQVYGKERYYMKFDLSSIPAGSQILGATLHLYNKYSPSIGESPYTPCTLTVEARKVASDGWIESTLTWNNAPPIGDIWDTKTIPFTQTESWTVWNVDTSWVAYQFLVDQTVSMAMRGTAEDTLTDCVVWWYTKDAYTWQPRAYLEVEYWETVVLNKEIQVTLENGMSEIVCFKVVVAPDAIPSTVDTINVTATSKTDNTVENSAICIAHARELAIVDVEITPENRDAQCTTVKELIDPCYRYDPVTFKVAVTNEGQLDDKYELEVVDLLGWGLKLDPQELFVPAGDTEYASLSVTVPEDVWYSTWDEITVIAVGKLATLMQDPLNATDSDTCMVHAALCKGVEIEVLPDSIEPQTGTPCSTLTWVVVIKNTGNTPDEFGISLRQLSYDCKQGGIEYHKDWENLRFVGQENEGWVDNQIWLDPCSKATGFLSVKIPDDARTSWWNDITVTVTNKENIEESKYIELHDSVTVQAHVLEPGPRIPEGVIEIAVEAEVVAIDVWPISYDFGVMDEHKENYTGDTYFTIRNVGNVKENILVRGTDAQSMPGEPVTSWELSDLAEGIDQYRLACYGAEVVGGRLWLDDEMPEWPKPLFTDSLCPGCERQFGVWIQTPSVITTPARMWARIKITAIAAMVYGIPKSP